MLRPFDIVTIAANIGDAEIRGRRGYVIGEVTSDQCGVFVYGIERVWCLTPRDVVPTGDRDEAACNERAPPIRVSRFGEVLD